MFEKSKSVKEGGVGSNDLPFRSMGGGGAAAVK